MYPAAGRLLALGLYPCTVYQKMVSRGGDTDDSSGPSKSVTPNAILVIKFEIVLLRLFTPHILPRIPLCFRLVDSPK